MFTTLCGLAHLTWLPKRIVWAEFSDWQRGSLNISANNPMKSDNGACSTLAIVASMETSYPHTMCFLDGSIWNTAPFLIGMRGQA